MKRTFIIVLVLTLAFSLSVAPAASATELNHADRLVARIEKAMGQKDGQTDATAAIAELWKYAEGNPANAFREIRTALQQRGFTETQIHRVLELQPRLETALAIPDSRQQTAALKPI